VAQRRVSIIAAVSIALVLTLTVFYFIMWANGVEAFAALAPAVLALGGSMLFGLSVYLFFGGREGPQPDFVTLALAVVLGFAAIKILGFLILVSARLASVGGWLIGVLAAICETWFTHAGIQASVARIAGTRWAGVAVAPFIAAAYHLGVYGQSGTALLFVFASFVVLCTAYALTDRLEIPMLIHLLVNVLG
jgi:membrane protease YdiL (CAAX protease family)